jgi:hypothetical protein
MRYALALMLVISAAEAQSLPAADGVRIREFYRLAVRIQDRVWPDWSKTPAPLLLVTNDSEFLTHHPAPPKEFVRAGEDVWVRTRVFDPHLLATFPAFGPPSVIVIGEPQNTEAKKSTPWVITLMHEHFHQLQDGWPGFNDAVAGLGLAHGNQTGMWMLNYPFPYEKPEVARSFQHLRDSLLQAVKEGDVKEFKRKGVEYARERKAFFAQLSADDHKYFSFQLWKEGMARYTQIRCAEAAAEYEATAEYAALADYEPFSAYAKRARALTLEELSRADLMDWKREVVYSFGAAEGLFLDRWNPGWEGQYFRHLLSTDELFEVK